MNILILILFSLMGGLALLMKNKTSENGGGDFTVVRDDDSTTPSHSGDEMSAKDITVLDIVDADQPTRMIRDYQLADMDHFQYEGQIERFNNNYAAL